MRALSFFYLIVIAFTGQESVARCASSRNSSVNDPVDFPLITPPIISDLPSASLSKCIASVE
jgi:hypothetical protein